MWSFNSVTSIVPYVPWTFCRLVLIGFMLPLTNGCIKSRCIFETTTGGLPVTAYITSIGCCKLWETSSASLFSLCLVWWISHSPPLWICMLKYVFNTELNHKYKSLYLQVNTGITQWLIFTSFAFSNTTKVTCWLSVTERNAVIKIRIWKVPKMIGYWSTLMQFVLQVKDTSCQLGSQRRWT